MNALKVKLNELWHNCDGYLCRVIDSDLKENLILAVIVKTYSAIATVNSKIYCYFDDPSIWIRKSGLICEKCYQDNPDQTMKCLEYICKNCL